MCHQHKKQDFVEATVSTFWGAGIDISNVYPDFDHVNMRGYNILGWLIKFVYSTMCGNSVSSTKSEHFHGSPWQEYLDLVINKKPVLRNLEFYKGLMMVERVSSVILADFGREECPC